MSNRRLELLPYGAHTYSKADSRWWPGAPVIARGKGGLVWDEHGREHVDWGMGINNVLIGHAEESIDEAAIRALKNGQAFSRPGVLEEQAAEAVLGLWPGEQIIFTKSGSSANDAAIKLARAVTDRQHIAFDGTAPFFSTSDWWCGHQPKYAGTLDAERGFALPFTYNDVDSLSRCFEQRPLAAVILEPARYERPTPAFVEAVNGLCRINDTLLILDCVVVGYRYGVGAEAFMRFEPDLFTLGKGMANGYSVAALCGKRQHMSRGASDVFLLSTTNGAESSGLAAAIETARFYREHDVIGTLKDVGLELGTLLERASTGTRHAGIWPGPTDYWCRPTLRRQPDAFYRALCEQGVLWPPNWICPCYRRTCAEMEQTRKALVYACEHVFNQRREVHAS